MRIGYARVSTVDQHLAAQWSALELAGCEFIYQETQSGKDTAGRPELRRLLEKLRPRDIVIVTKLDRLARSTSDLLDLFARITKSGASVCSLSEPWADTSSPAGTLIVTVMAGIAEFERGRMLERCNEGRLAARAAGRSLGRKPKLTGVQETELLSMLDAGRPVGDVAEVFGVHRNTIFRIKAARAATLNA